MIQMYKSDWHKKLLPTDCSEDSTRIKHEKKNCETDSNQGSEHEESLNSKQKFAQT